ncbi:hypothetical protein Tco_0838285 [Tanacetum coccineum]|uniref:Uncharacterized protein n=1 Tax=Tanacetum coccineum TaxID=301880 RepID=A0ABQ5ARE9_9ASTR
MIQHCRRHDDHQEDDAPPEGEKRVKRHKALKRSKSARVIDEDEVILKDETSELIAELQVVDKHVLTICDYARMKATLNDALSIEAYELYSIVYKPSTSLIYLNSKDEKRVMCLTEIVKFYDATLEKVLKERNNQATKSPRAYEKMEIFSEWKTNSIDDEASVIINH